jgi:hypothetical protein
LPEDVTRAISEIMTFQNNEGFTNFVREYGERHEEVDRFNFDNNDVYGWVHKKYYP